MRCWSSWSESEGICGCKTYCQAPLPFDLVVSDRRGAELEVWQSDLSASGRQVFIETGQAYRTAHAGRVGTGRSSSRDGILLLPKM